MRKKHEVNVRKNSVVNFQIGLIAALLFTYVMFEVFTASTVMYDQKVVIDNRIDDPVEFVFTVKKDIVVDEKIAEARPEKPKKSSAFETGDNDTRLEKLVPVIGDNEKVDAITLENPDLRPDDIIEGSDEEPLIVPFRVVEFVPVYPGCERLKTNAERSVCFQEKIRRKVSRAFNSGLGEDLGLNGRQRITVLFEIGTDGYITDVKARAAHPRLEKEAIRVTKLLPKMTPGMQRDTPVAVQYALPIVFEVR